MMMEYHALWSFKQKSTWDIGSKDAVDIQRDMIKCIRKIEKNHIEIEIHKDCDKVFI